MKFTVSIDINKPLDFVIQTFDDPENLKRWMKGLVSFEPISGTPGQPGAKSKLTFNHNGRKMEMEETITVKNLPKEFSGTYEISGIWNLVQNQFEALSPNLTRYTSVQEFRMKAPMKWFSLLLQPMFRKQSLQHLQSFKQFTESL
ncbi:SRPBCC family protein [Leptospira congkakensis]|uniref:SRPBCC family protein n=1 Tax=Leptospira congkakensis TaxID=2484932 RepID=A0A4Z1AID7_9LEPT|nr:SRPBCC family protein [Leptospira congkakensis]TGL84872.1 SRPBCC family protein [Leptospira congkakensis]TGL92115.1 SRPBCC family protein [Leptospira congkakensis]TGL96674.1 SRPBCC family protein [Leptospira congkakensis]